MPSQFLLFLGEPSLERLNTWPRLSTPQRAQVLLDGNLHLLNVSRPHEEIPLPAPQKGCRQLTFELEVFADGSLKIAHGLVGHPTNAATPRVRIERVHDDHTKALPVILLFQGLPPRHRLHARLAPRRVKLHRHEPDARPRENALHVQLFTRPRLVRTDHKGKRE